MGLIRKTGMGPIAVDLGSTCLRMLQVTDGASAPAIAAWAEVEIPPGMEAGPDRDGWLVREVRAAVRTRGFQGRAAVSALTAREYQLKTIRLPTMPAEDLAAAVAFEAQERFGFDPAGFETRFLVAGQVRQGNDLREEMLVFAAPRESIERRVQLLHAAGLETVALDVAPLATARSFVRFLRRAEDTGSVNLFLDVGWTATHLVLTRGPEVCFVKLIDLGGRALTRGVAERLQLPDEDVVRIRRGIIAAAASGRPASDFPAELVQMVSDAVVPQLEHLAREIHLALRYCTVTFRGHKPDCLTVVGGEAHEPALLPMLAEGVEGAVTIGDPLRGLAGSGVVAPQDRKHVRPAWAVAAGLALRGSRWVTISSPVDATAKAVAAHA